MSIILMRLFYSVYFIGLLLSLLNALSILVFDKTPFKQKVVTFLKMLGLSFVWPLAVMSPQGRVVLTKRIQKM